MACLKKTFLRNVTLAVIFQLIETFSGTLVFVCSAFLGWLESESAEGEMKACRSPPSR